MEHRLKKFTCKSNQKEEKYGRYNEDSLCDFSKNKKKESERKFVGKYIIE